MLKPLCIALGVLLLGVSLGGCSKCDWFRSDPRAALQSCK
jgi:hypothetical protein